MAKAELKTMAIEMKKSGMSHGVIAKHLGVAKSSVSVMKLKDGVKIEERECKQCRKLRRSEIQRKRRELRLSMGKKPRKRRTSD